ncbi:hypothetical protein D3C84_1139780 [compost metagenome]
MRRVNLADAKVHHRGRCLDRQAFGGLAGAAVIGDIAFGTGGFEADVQLVVNRQGRMIARLENQA